MNFPRQITRPEHWLLSSISIILSSVLLTSCSGGSDIQVVVPTTGDTAGAEPRIQLGLGASARAQLQVSTTSAQAVLVAGDTTTSSISTVMRVEAVLRTDAGSFPVTVSIDALRDLDAFSPDDLRPVETNFGSVVQRYNVQGETLRHESEDSIVNILALDTFSLPPLTFSHPATPIGIGAQWTERSVTESLTLTMVTKVDALSTDSISISRTLETGSDEQNRFQLTGSISAVYALPSLLMQSADITINYSYEDQLYINGILQPIVESSSLIQTIREVTS